MVEGWRAGDVGVVSGVGIWAHVGDKAEGRGVLLLGSSVLTSDVLSCPPSLDLLCGLTSLASAICGDIEAGIWFPLLCLFEGIPLADARLLAMEELGSRCGGGSNGDEC